MTNRMVCCLAVSFAAGLLYGRERSICICLGLTGFLLFRVFYLWKQQGRQTVPITVFHMLLCMVLFFVGMFHYEEQQEKFQRTRQYAEQQGNIQVQGRIYWKEQKQDQFIYYLKDAWILVEGKYEPSEKIQVYSSTDSYQIGNYIQVVGRYEAFQLPRNEGNFNEEQYYYSKNIGLRMTAYQEKLLENDIEKYKVWLLELRQDMEQVFLKYMSEQAAGIMANMTLGSKNLADKEVKALYQKAGISHVLAVSGLHISILGMGLYRLLRRIYCPIPVASALTVGVVYSFGVLTGMELSTTRAVIMFFMMMLAGSLGYTYDTVTALSVSGMLQLWENPFVLWYAGFLLSYTAVLGAVVITGVVKNVWKKRAGRILETIEGSLCIQMATLPVLLFFYYEVSGYSVLVNACVLPFMGILLFFGAAGGVIGLFHGGMATVVLKVPEWILVGCQWICAFFSGLPGNCIITGKPSMEKIILYYILLLIILYIIRSTGKRRCFLGSIVLMAILCWGNGTKGTEVDFLDVGQGDGIFLQSEKGNGVFIDGGSTDVGKVGTYRILPFLKCRGMKEISLWFVSHTDEDHISGLKEILEEGYPVRNIVLAEGIVKDEAWSNLVELAEKNGSNIYYLKAGESITLDEMHFTVLYPWKEGIDRNECSMVLLAELEGMTGLFSGDIGEDQELELVNNKEFQKLMKKPIDFYKVAHHGSKESNSLEFLETISPELAVVSCGENNSYGHPHKETLERLEKMGSRILCTMESGQITVRIEEEKGVIEKELLFFCLLLEKVDNM